MASPTSPHVHRLGTLAELATLRASLPAGAILVLYFHADWAPPCVHMATLISALADSYAPGGATTTTTTTTSTTTIADTPPTVAFAQITAEEAVDFSTRYDVSSVPFTVIVSAHPAGGKDEAVLEKISGGDAAKLRAAIERLAGPASRAAVPPAQKVEPAAPAPVSASADAAASAGGAAGEEPAGGAKSKEELFRELGQLVKAAPVMVFMKGIPAEPQCGFSRQLVALLREKSVKFGFFNILANEEVRQGLKEFADWPTFPQLWTDGELVGGLDIVREEFENDAEFMSAYRVPAAPAPAE